MHLFNSEFEYGFDFRISDFQNKPVVLIDVK